MHTAPRVAIRVDASAKMGTGHLKRCLSLAQALAESGAQVVFICRPLDAVAEQVLSTANVATRWLPAALGSFTPESDAPQHAAWAGLPQAQDATDTLQALAGWHPDWLVVDHYAFDARWHQALRKALGCRLLVIDDIADRTIDADTLLDHNWHADHGAKYAGRLTREPHWLTGPRYALLAPAFRHASRYRFHPEVRSIGIFMGGTDPDGISAKVLGSCREAGFTGVIEVVSTTANPYLSALHAICNATPGTLLTLDEPNLSGFFARHDLQIGAGGGATWERCCNGTPTIAIAVAANQSAVLSALEQLGALRTARLPTESSTAVPLLSDVLHEMLATPMARQQLCQQAATLLDGRGAQRVALRLMGKYLQLRPATGDDADLLYAWRNHPTVRTVSVHTDVIPFPDHQRWLQRVRQAPDRWLFVAQVGQIPVGSIRFDQLNDDRLEVSLYLDPELQGLGLGPQLLLAGEQQMAQLRGTIFIVEATVKTGNTASQRLFEGCGYYGGPQFYRKRVHPASEKYSKTHENT